MRQGADIKGAREKKEFSFAALIYRYQSLVNILNAPIPIILPD